MGKLTEIAAVVILIGGMGGGTYYLHQLHSPRTMMTAAVKDMNDGIIGDYYTDELKKNLETAKKGGELIALFSAAAKQELVHTIMQKMSEVEWTLDSVEYNGTSGTACVDFKYSYAILELDGTIVFNIQKIEPEGGFLDKLKANPWRISSIEKIDF